MVMDKYALNMNKNAYFHNPKCIYTDLPNSVKQDE